MTHHVIHPTQALVSVCGFTVTMSQLIWSLNEDTFMIT